MVSKSKILGKPTLVFISVGSTNFQFDRLFSALDKVLTATNKNVNLVIQYGNSKYIWKNKKVKLIDYMTPSKIIFLIKNADKIISHAGPISIVQTVKYSKNLPLIIPRLAKFREHVDNHQLYFTKFLRTQLPQEFQKCFITEENINKNVFDYLNKKSEKNVLGRYLFRFSNRLTIIKKINKYLTD